MNDKLDNQTWSQEAHHVCAVLKNVRAKILASASEAKRSAGDIHPVLDEGQRKFGENRVQEAHGKWPQLRAEFADIELHLIGALQSTKAAETVAHL